MIGALTGTVFAHRNPLIIMAGGVGYSVFVPLRLMAGMKKDDLCTLFIHTHVRDDAIDLFGFSTEEELGLFTLLLSVPGIGPKTAMLVVDRGVTAVETAVSSANVDFFVTIPRLGKKNAQKIIIELKQKIGSHRDLDLNEAQSPESKTLTEALISMGFNRREVVDTVRELATTESSLEVKLRDAIKRLGKKNL